ncbi:hypothetical protein [Halolamina rubra]|uniref:hypothetical protein n=1 Tax=Halolamina rubra TaxID=1380430 RepID=UPI0006790811|nr:hypothetical protein [Halolamina rubra]
MDERRVQSLVHAGVATLLAVAGVVFAVRPGGPADWAYGLVALGVLFFGVSAVPRVREHGAYNALAAAFATAVCLVAYLGSGTWFVGALALASGVGTLIELARWRR